MREPSKRSGVSRKVGRTAFSYCTDDVCSTDAYEITLNLSMPSRLFNVLLFIDAGWSERLLAAFQYSFTASFESELEGRGRDEIPAVSADIRLWCGIGGS